MEYRRIFYSFLFSVFFFAVSSWDDDHFSCNEVICGPRVSFCMLINSCNCSMTPDDLITKNCSCCKDCLQCLGELFSECCSCVGLCRPSKPVDPCLGMSSYVNTLTPAEDQMSLFEIITSEPHSHWTVKTFPALNSIFYKLPPEQREANWKTFADMNCTVAFMKNCMSNDKCRHACNSMGASSIRWFHTGCCECCGHHCVDFGLRESACEECGEIEGLAKDCAQAGSSKSRSDEL